MMASDGMGDRLKEGEWDKNKKYWLQKIEELDKNINTFRKKIVVSKRNLGGVNAGQES